MALNEVSVSAPSDCSAWNPSGFSLLLGDPHGCWGMQPLGRACTAPCPGTQRRAGLIYHSWGFIFFFSSALTQKYKCTEEYANFFIGKTYHNIVFRE